MELVMKTVQGNTKKNQSVLMCENTIKGATPYFHSIVAGSHMVFPANMGKHHITTLVQGTAVFQIDGKDYRFDERVTVIPGLDQSMTVQAETAVELLEVQLEMEAEDYRDIKTFDAVFPYIQPYATSKQYTDRCKTPKTINRIMVEQRHVPRFAMGSVESYGPDHVVPHGHPLLDQFFFSFPENHMTVLIDGERVPMAGNTLLYIPLGSDHGVDVQQGETMHYIWIDFMMDRALATAALDKGHVPTGLMRDFKEEDKTRNP